MQFSPYVLLRHPSYNLSRLDLFAVSSKEYPDLEEVIEERRKHFLSFITSTDLLLSLPFSSKTVYQAIPHYEFHAAVKIRKKEKQTERALMKYLSRMSLNPSPLAAFSKSQFVDWDWNMLKPKNKYELSLSLTQRKEFFDLCYCDVGLQKYMRYRLNPSLRQQVHSQEFIYLHRDGEEENRVVLEYDKQFETMFSSLKKKDFTFEQFVKQTDYDVNDFLEAQLIVPSYPIYSEHEFISTLIGDINSRHNLSFRVEDITGIYKDKLMDQEAIAQQKHWESQLLAFAKKIDVGLDHKLYSERTYYLNTYSNERITKPSFDKDLLSKEVLRIAALADSIRSKVDMSSLNWDNVFDAPQTQQEGHFDLDGLNIEHKSDFEIQWNITSNDSTKKYSSLGIMLRFSDSILPRLINVSTPYGKFFAPTLGLAGEEAKSDLKNWVQEAGQDKVVLKDASLHNKNRGHEFLPELNSFGLDFHTPVHKRVTLDILENGTVVNDESKKTVSMVNLGVEDYNARSTFYQNLYNHSSRLPNLPALVNAIQKKYIKAMDEYVSSSPKLVTNHLELGCRKWHVSKDGFELFADAKENHIAQLNAWRKKYQIPRIVEYKVDEGKAFFLDFLNHWSVDSFLKLIRKMETNCVLEAMGFDEEIKGKRLYEAYFEIKQRITKE